MFQRRERVAAVCAAMVVLCVLGRAPRLFCQDAETDLIHHIGWDLEAGRNDAALAEARQGVTQYPASAILWHLLGVAQSKKGLKEKARQSFLSAIRIDPTIPQDYYDLGILDMQTGRYDEAATMLKTYAGVNPQNGKAHLLLGMAYQAQNHPGRAIEEFNKAVELSPDLALAHYYLGTAEERQGNSKAALAQYQMELKINPGFYDVYWKAGNLQLGLRDFKAAEDLFRRGIALRPLHYEAYFGLAKVFLAQQDYAQAASQLEMVIALEPQDIEAHEMLGGVYEKLGKTMEAKREELVVETLRSENETTDSKH